MHDFEKWREHIELHPEEDWLAPIIRAGDELLATELIDRFPTLLGYCGSYNLNLLQVAALARKPRMADLLVSRGLKLDIMSACALGQTATVRSMLDDDPDLIRKQTSFQRSLLHVAAADAATEMTEMLLLRGADVNDNRNFDRMTPLFPASLANAQLLLANDAEVNARSKNGFTPLHFASMYGNVEMAKLLLKYGADPDAQTDGRQTPWAMAVRQRHSAITALLRNAASNRSP